MGISRSIHQHPQLSRGFLLNSCLRLPESTGSKAVAEIPRPQPGSVGDTRLFAGRTPSSIRRVGRGAGAGGFQRCRREAWRSKRKGTEGK